MTITRVAVYGTLRDGYGADGKWQGLTTSVTRNQRVRGHRLVDTGAFPFAVPTPGSTIEVDVLEFDTDTIDDVMVRFDRYEGVPSLYVRDVVYPYNPDCTKRVELVSPESAWIYVPSERHADRAQHLPTVPNGNWANAGRYAGGTL